MRLRASAVDKWAPVEQRGVSFARGVFSGFVDQAAASDPKRRAELTQAPAEVTTTPELV